MLKGRKQLRANQFIGRIPTCSKKEEQKQKQLLANLQGGKASDLKSVRGTDAMTGKEYTYFYGKGNC